MTEALQIAIVGGGIGGLTAAVALRARGAKVTVFEQAEELREIGAGISLNPNAAAVAQAPRTRQALGGYRNADVWIERPDVSRRAVAVAPPIVTPVLEIQILAMVTTYIALTS
jgi:2-polyprenyl-6-methoxyphenol hydroxylase and related FAD-dependent oxidoreductases